MDYDVAIIGSGPAGLTAGIYCARYGLKTIIIEKSLVGGTVTLAHSIQNWPGEKNITGPELMKKFEEHAKESGAEIKSAQVTAIKDGVEKEIVFGGESIKVRAIIISVGAKSRWLKVKGEQEYLNKGVHFCATCDGPMYSGKNVVVIGEDHRAVEEAHYLSTVTDKVTIITSKKELSADKAKQDMLKNVDVLTETNVVEFRGEQFLNELVLKDATGKEFSLEANGAFIYIGTEPNTEIIDVEKDNDGRIIVDTGMKTNKKGIFAAGDCIKKDLMQISTCVGEGATAAYSAATFVRENK
jgi:thioredoxin reductase (NADPH)